MMLAITPELMVRFALIAGLLHLKQCFNASKYIEMALCIF